MGIRLYEVEKNLFRACSNTISVSIVFFGTLYNKSGTIIKSICKINVPKQYDQHIMVHHLILMETTYHLRILIISTHPFCYDNIA